MSERKEQPRRVYLSAQLQQPITQYVTYNPDLEQIKKGEHACAIDMDKHTGQFVLRANAPHYEQQLEALANLVKLGRLTEVPAGKESTMKLMLSPGGEMINPDSDRAKKDALIEAQRQLAEKTEQITVMKAGMSDKDAEIEELKQQLAKRK